MRRLTGSIANAALPIACSGLALSGIVVLVLFVLYMTFVPGLPTELGFTLNHWKIVFSGRLWTKVIPNTAIIGFGSGVTVGAALQFPVRSVETIELERSVVDASRFFADVNHLDYKIGRASCRERVCQYV